MRVISDLERLWHTRLRATEQARDVGDAVITAVIGLVLLGIGLVGLWDGEVERIPGVGREAHVVTLLLGCAIMLVKRRRPLAALAAGAVVLAVDLWLSGSIGPVLVLFDLLYSAAMFASQPAVDRLRVAAWATVAATLGLAWWATGDLRVTVFLGLQLFAVVMTPLWWGLAVRRQTELADLARARADDLRRLAELREAEVLAQERARMARDLHDAIAGNLSAIAIHAEAALSAPGEGRARDRHALDAIRAAGVTSLQEMRSMIMLLRSGSDPVAAPARLARADELVDLARHAGLAVTWAGDGPADLPALPAAVDQAAYRILQEALTNAAKHAPAAEVAVQIGVEADRLLLRVDSCRTAPAGTPRPVDTLSGTALPDDALPDDALPDDALPDDGSRLGLLTMRERAESLGGWFTAGWSGAGRERWQVRAELPLEVGR